MKPVVRSYRQELPAVDDLVMVQYRESTDAVIYAELLEYPGVEGMMILSEYSRSANDIRKAYFESGKRDVLRVLEVVPSRGMVSLSKRHRKPEEVSEYGKRYAKTAKVAKIVSEWAASAGVDEAHLYDTFVWDLYDEYDHAYDYFTEVGESGTVPPIDGGALLANVLSRRLVKPVVKMETIIEITCFDVNGVVAIRNALSGLPDDISCQLVASPTYSVSATGRNTDELMKKVNDAVDAIKSKAVELLCNVAVRREALVV